MRASPRSRPRSNRARFAFLKYPPLNLERRAMMRRRINPAAPATSCPAPSDQAADRRRTRKSVPAVLQTDAALGPSWLCLERQVSSPVVSIRDEQGFHHADAKPLLCVRGSKNGFPPHSWFYHSGAPVASKACLPRQKLRRRRRNGAGYFLSHSALHGHQDSRSVQRTGDPTRLPPRPRATRPLRGWHQLRRSCRLERQSILRGLQDAQCAA